MASDAAIVAAVVLADLFAPIPAELSMPLGGFYGRQGQLNRVLAVLAAGAWLGLRIW